MAEAVGTAAEEMARAVPIGMAAWLVKSMKDVAQSKAEVQEVGFGITSVFRAHFAEMADHLMAEKTGRMPH